MPLGVSVSPLYLIPMWLAWRVVPFNRPLFLVVSAAAVALTVIGFAVSPSGGPAWMAAANRALGSATLGVASWLFLRERRRTEAGERVEGQFRALVEQSADGMLVVNRSGNITFMNAAAERLFEYGSDQLLGRSIETLIPVRVRSRHAEERLAFQGAPGPRPMGAGRDLFALRRDGTEIPVEVSLTPITTDAGTATLCTVVDISRRKRDEAQLRSSEEQFRASFELSAVGQAQVDARTGRFIRVNDRYCQIVGYEREELLHLTPSDLTHPDDREADRANIVKILSGATDEYHSQKRYLRKDGQVQWVRVAARLLRDSDGRPAQTIAVIEDITQRREAEEALAKNRETLELAQHAGRVGTFEMDVRTGRTEWSVSAEQLYGLPPGGFDGRYETWLRMVHPDDRDAAEAAVRCAVESQRDLDAEFRIVRPDGEVRWLAAKGRVFYDVSGAPVRMVGLNQDITERKEAEEALRESEARFRHMADAAPALVWMSGPDARCTWFNRRWLEYTGRTMEQELGNGWTEGVHPGDVHRCLEVYVQGFERREEFEMEYRLRRADGTYGWVLDHGVPLYTPDGTFTGYMGSGMEITERKRAEEELQQMNLDLERRVAERTKAVTQSQRRLRALASELSLTEQRERRRLASELHDYLAQLLVLGRLHLGQVLRLPTADKPAALIKEADQALDQALSYTRSLVAELAPPVLGQFGLGPALVWLGEQMDRHGLTVEVDVPPDVPVLPHDQEALLFQSARELLLNVVKHAHSDRAVLTVRTDEAGRLEIVVEDHGQGFDPEIVEDTSLDKFGLFSIRERMISLGGWFQVASRPGAGTQATLVVPLATGETRGKEGGGQREGVEDVVTQPALAHTPVPLTPEMSSALPAAHPPRAIRVLLVDDHAMVREGLRSILEGYPETSVIGEAGDGEEAVALARDLCPDVVIMDMNLPRLDGVQATRLIKQDRPDIAVVGLSVNSTRQAADAMAKAGADEFLTKESAADRLYHTIVRVTGRRSTLRTPQQEDLPFSSSSGS